MAMNSPKTADPRGLVQLRSTLEASHGPLMDNTQLREALGYRTQSAFDRAVKRGQIRVRIFRIPGRKGWFALAADVAVWIWTAREQHAHGEKGAKCVEAGFGGDRQRGD